MAQRKPMNPTTRIVLMAALILCILWVLGLGAWLVYKDFQYNTYLNEKQGFRIKYPKTWIVSDKAIPNMIAGFVSPKENALDTFLENIAITATDFSGKSLTLDEYAQQTIRRMKMLFKNLKVEGPLPSLLSGHQGKKIVLRAGGPNASVIVIYVFIYKNKAYNITYMGVADRYPKDSAIIVDMINSLKVYF